MEKVCHSFSQAWLVRGRVQTVSGGAGATRRKVTAAMEWAKEELVKKLSEHSKTYPGAGPTVLMAVVGVACAGNSTTSIENPPPASPPPPPHSPSSSPPCVWSALNLLCSTLDGVRTIVTAKHSKEPSPHPITALLSDLSGDDLQETAVLVAPLLVETSLMHCPVLPPALHSTVRALVSSLWDHFNSCPTWYSAHSLNQVLTMILPRYSEMRSIIDEFIPFANTAIQAQSLELLVFASSLLPSLHMAGYSSLSISVLHNTLSALSSLEPSLLSGIHAQLAAVHTANATTLLFSTGLITGDQAVQHVSLVAELATKAPHLPCYHLSLAVLLHDLLAALHRNILPLVDTITARWLQEFHTTQEIFQEKSMEYGLSVLWGLAGLLGVNPTMQNLWYVRHRMPTRFLESLFPLVRAGMEKISPQDDSSAIATAAWLLAQAYHTLTENIRKTEKVPTALEYIAETSILPSLVSSLKNFCTHPAKHVPEIKCFLNVLQSCGGAFPPVDLSTIFLPITRCTELQVIAVKVAIHLCKRMQGMRLVATHICNLLLLGCLQTEAQCILLENLRDILDLIEVNKYLQPFSVWAVQQFPQSKAVLLSLLKGLKSVLEAITSETSSSTVSCSHVSAEDVRQIVTSSWESVCAAREHWDLLCGASQGKEEEEGEIDAMMQKGIRSTGPLLEEFSECLWLANYNVDLTQLQRSNSTRCVALNCLLYCYWVQSGRKTGIELKPVLKWTLKNCELSLANIVQEKLFLAIRHICFECHSKNTLVIQTELLHTILEWLRKHMPSFSRSQFILALLSVCVVASPTAPALQSSSQPLREWLAAFTLPPSPPVRENVLQCLLQLVAQHQSDTHIHCLSMLEQLAVSPEYCKPAVWTSVAHMM